MIFSFSSGNSMGGEGHRPPVTVENKYLKNLMALLILAFFRCLVRYFKSPPAFGG